MIISRYNGNRPVRHEAQNRGDLKVGNLGNVAIESQNQIRRSIHTIVNKEIGLAEGVPLVATLKSRLSEVSPFGWSED